MPTDFETFLATFCIWDFQNKCSSSITPKNRTSFTQSEFQYRSLIEKCKSSFCLFCFVLNRIKCDFFMLIESLLAWNQLDSFFNSLFTIYISWSGSLWGKNNVGIIGKKYEIHGLWHITQVINVYNKNNNEPKIDP